MTYVYGNNIDTDRIIAGKYTKTLNFADLAAHVLEDLDPNFATNVKAGDILVAGENFGCGSSREQAPIALKAAGVSVVVATSFARIFFRNAINIGLPILEIGAHTINTGDDVEVLLADGMVVNKTQKTTYAVAPMSKVMMSILADGGLVNYLKKHGDYKL
jgi:3-isopropylmalate dehydratase small subunit